MILFGAEHKKKTSIQPLFNIFSNPTLLKLELLGISVLLGTLMQLGTPKIALIQQNRTLYPQFLSLLFVLKHAPRKPK